jgi:hypothetical protein
MRKYANLGAFPDGWWDDPTRPIALTHHLESRDIYLRCRERGHFAEARDFYLSHIMSTSEIHTMVEKGDVIEIFPFSHSL